MLDLAVDLLLLVLFLFFSAVPMFFIHKWVRTKDVWAKRIVYSMGGIGSLLLGAVISYNVMSMAVKSIQDAKYREQREALDSKRKAELPTMYSNLNSIQDRFERYEKLKSYSFDKSELDGWYSSNVKIVADTLAAAVIKECGSGKKLDYVYRDAIKRHKISPPASNRGLLNIVSDKLNPMTSSVVFGNRHKCVENQFGSQIKDVEGISASKFVSLLRKQMLRNKFDHDDLYRFIDAYQDNVPDAQQGSFWAAVKSIPPTIIGKAVMRAIDKEVRKIQVEPALLERKKRLLDLQDKVNIGAMFLGEDSRLVRHARTEYPKMIPSDSAIQKQQREILRSIGSSN